MTWSLVAMIAVLAIILVIVAFLLGGIVYVLRDPKRPRRCRTRDISMGASYCDRHDVEFATGRRCPHDPTVVRS